jgi:hypothetical protein
LSVPASLRGADLTEGCKLSVSYLR